MYSGEFVRALVHAGVFFGCIVVISTFGDKNDAIAVLFALTLTFWYFFMIFDSVRVARAKQLGQPVPDLFGMGLGAPAQPPSAGAVVADVTPQPEPSRFPVGAIVLIGIGFLFLLSTLNLFAFDWFEHLWPLFLIGLGIYMFYRQRQRAVCQCVRCTAGRSMGAAIVTTLGVWFLVHSFYMEFAHRTWPIILIVIGIVLFLRNSVVVAVGSTVLSMVIACLGAYAIARLTFPGRALLARGLVFTYLVPTSLLFIPMFALMSVLRLTDSLHGLIIAYLGFDVPFCTWLLMGYFKSVPVELEEAARVDGCNRVSALVRVVLPMSLPALVVVTFFSFTHAWNEFLYAHVFTSTTSARTVTTGLVNFMSQDVFFWGPLMASTVMSALPPVLMFLVFQRWVVKGLTLGGVKG